MSIIADSGAAAGYGVAAGYGAVASPGTVADSGASLGSGTWELYQRLIDGIPAGIGVKGWCLGRRWSYVESERGTGVAMTVSGGRGLDRRGSILGGKPTMANLTELRELAAYACSWCFEEASIGVAALNAWYNNAENNPLLNTSMLVQYVTFGGYGASVAGAVASAVAGGDSGTAAVVGADGASGADEDAGAAVPKAADATATTKATAPSDLPRQGDILESEVRAHLGKKVAVIGHFPHLEQLAELCELSVLERSPSGSDFPDSACEYILPEQDLVVITGTALTNKTMPRLLELSRSARTVLLGPSCVCSPVLLEYGVDLIGATAVVDSIKALPQLTHGIHLPFGQGLEMIRFGA